MLSIYPGTGSGTKTNDTYFFELLDKLTGVRSHPFSCGRAAMVFGLKAMSFSRNQEILMPPWIGHCVHSALSRVMLPALAPSERTDAIFVFHQWGYPQNLDIIEEMASKRGWFILNDCCNTLFSQYRDIPLLSWGDMAVTSFSKLFPCNLGGSLISSKEEILRDIDKNYEINADKNSEAVAEAYRVLALSKSGKLQENEHYKVEAVFGYLPDMVAIPKCIHNNLPTSKKELDADLNHRQELLFMIESIMPERVPNHEECDVVPFAIPVRGDVGRLRAISRDIYEKLDTSLPVLHFDFARNMLNPEYHPALAIGCHREWTVSLVEKICEIIKKNI